MGISYRDIENLANYAERVSKREAHSVTMDSRVSRKILTELTGISRCSKIPLRGKRSVNYNGGVEYNSPFDVNPVGWGFENACGIVLEFANQPSDPSSYWDGGTLSSAGRTPINGFYNRGTGLQDVFIVNGTPGGAFEFTGPRIERLGTSEKCLMVQSQVGSPRFGASTMVPTGFLKESTVFYLEFSARAYGAHLPWSFIQSNGGRLDIALSESYKTAEGDYYLPLVPLSGGFACSLTVQAKFFDAGGNSAGQYDSEPIPLPDFAPWVNPTFAISAPKGTTSVQFVFQASSAPGSQAVSFLLDNVAVYPEQSVLKSGSIETHVIGFSGNSSQGPQVRSSSYIYGVRTLYTSPPATSAHRLSVNGTVLSHNPATPSLATKDRGFCPVNSYVSAGDVLTLGLTSGTASAGIAYIDFSTI